MKPLTDSPLATSDVNFRFIRIRIASVGIEEGMNLTSHSFQNMKHGKDICIEACIYVVVS